MPACYVIDKERRLVTTTVTGRLTFTEAKTHQDQLAVDPDFAPEFNQLIDARKLAKWDMSLKEARALVGRRFFSPSSRRAVVAVSPAVFGLGPFFKAYSRLAKDREHIAVFYDREAALKWLGLENFPQ